MNGIFVTGTDTDIGKTIVSAVLMNSLRASRDVCYWKPVQTGVEEDNDTETVRTLGSCNDDEIHDFGIRLEKPLSPHLSARLAGEEFSIADVLERRPEAREERFFVVEGAGGVFVPLNKMELMIDLIEILNLPALIVSRSRLGTINHTLLTIEALRNRDIKIAGVVMNGESNNENKKAIEYFGKVGVLAEIPHFEELSPEVLGGVKIDF